MKVMVGWVKGNEPALLTMAQIMAVVIMGAMINMITMGAMGVTLEMTRPVFLAIISFTPPSALSPEWKPGT